MSTEEISRMGESKISQALARGIFNSWVPILAVFSALVISTGYLMFKLYVTTDLLVENTRKSLIKDVKSKCRLLDEFFAQRLNDIDSLSNSNIFSSYYHSKLLGMSKEYGLFALGLLMEEELDRRLESVRDSGMQVFVAGVFYEFENSEAIAKSHGLNFQEWVDPQIFEGFVASKSAEPKLHAICRNSTCRIFITKPVVYEHIERGLLALEISGEIIDQKVREDVPQDYESWSGLFDDNGTVLVGPAGTVGRPVSGLFGVPVGPDKTDLPVSTKSLEQAGPAMEANLFLGKLEVNSWTAFRIVPSSVFGRGPSYVAWITWFFLFILSALLLIALVIRSLRRRSQIYRQLKNAHDELEHRVQERTSALASANQELVSEIRERKQAQKKLYQQAQVLASITDSLLIISREMKIIFSNEASREIFDVGDPDKINSHFCYEILRHSPNLCDECPVVDVLEDEKPHKSVMCYVGKDGRESWFHNNAFPYYDDSGELLGAILLSTDYSIQKETEKALNYAREQAEAASISKSEFLMRMSHEIRTPMNAVLGTLDLILDYENQLQHRDLLMNAKLAAESLQGVLNDILDFSKVEAQRIDILCNEFSLRHLVEQVVDTLNLRAREKNIELVAHYLCDVPDQVLGDDLRIRQILTNLLGNSIKFTHSGEIFLKVEYFEDKSTDGHFSFEVTDTGIGIASENLEKIFDPFDQAEGFVARTYGGTGLGLSITKSLVELMGGRILVESEVGKGSSFRVTIPLKLTRGGDGVTDECQISAEGEIVLILDDNRKSAETLKANLDRLGFDSRVECDPSKLSELIEQHFQASRRPSYIFIDHEMPGLDGIAVLKSLNEFHNVCKVFMAHPAQLAAIEEAKANGADHFLSKPFKLNEIIKLFDSSSDVAAIGGTLTVHKPQPEMPIRLDDEARSAIRILLAEDNTVNQKLIQRTLEKKKFTVVTSNNGVEAVERFKSEPFDLVLMDLQMPVLDGLNATRMIRQFEMGKKRRTPIVAMTAHAFQETQSVCVEAGMDHYLSKPISGRLLIEKIESILAGSHTM